MDSSITLPHTQGKSGLPAARRDYRARALLALALAIAVLGALVSWMPGRSVVGQRIPARLDAAPSQPASFAELKAAGTAGRELAADELLLPDVKTAAGDPGEMAARKVLHDAAREIKAKRYDAALTMLDAARPRVQKYPESYVLVGRALEGRKDFATARDFYNTALDRNPMLADAYWGMATTSEALGDLHTALGGMRSFLHTVPNPDPNRLKVAQARSAIWEWEAQLGRGPWGPTKGIMPGLTAAQARREPGRGAAILMPLPGTQRPDGSTKFEIKHQDKIEMFKK